MDGYHFIFKYVIVGDTSVGKSCILLNYTEQRFIEEHDTTIGVEFGSQMFKYKNKLYKIQIWDTAGQESFRSITRSYYKGSIGVVLCFDVTRKESFYNIVKWRNDVLECVHEHVVIFLVGNKCDLEEKREVSYVDAKSYADQHHIEYVETSAKTGHNVQKLFEDMTIRICEKIDNQSVDFTNDTLGIKLGALFSQTQVQQEAKEEPVKKNQCC